jgi:AP endonuclease-1
MPPKTKRKATEEGPPPKKRVKKTDTMTSQVSVASEAGSEIDPSGQPTNTKLPDEISFPERVPGTRRISAWNVCGWAASNKKVGTQEPLGMYGVD